MSGSDQIDSRNDQATKFTSMTSRLQNVPTAAKEYTNSNQKSANTPRQINSARYSTAFGSGKLVMPQKQEYVRKEKIIKQLAK